MKTTWRSLLWANAACGAFNLSMLVWHVYGDRLGWALVAAVSLLPSGFGIDQCLRAMKMTKKERP